MTTTGTAGHETASWYYVGSFGQLGPLTLDQLEELVDGGVIEADTHVWNPGMPNWMPAAQVAALVGSLGKRTRYAEPPPIPGSTARPPVSPTPPVHGTSPGVTGVPLFHARQADINAAYAAYAAYAAPYGLRSDRDRTVAGILNIVFPGVGRIYLGYFALGLIQMIAVIGTCGVLHIWSIVDGAMMLSGNVKVDGYGRMIDP